MKTQAIVPKDGTIICPLAKSYFPPEAVEAIEKLRGAGTIGKKLVLEKSPDCDQIIVLTAKGSNPGKRPQPILMAMAADLRNAIEKFFQKEDSLKEVERSLIHA